MPRGPRDWYGDARRKPAEPERASRADEPQTVSQIVKYVRFYLARKFPKVTVVGEIGQLRRVRGTTYFSLKDARSALPCVLFSSASQKLRVPLREGMRVVVSGAVTVYEQQSKVQLEVKTLELVGEGTELIALERLKAKLKAEGLFDDARKKALPMLPRTLGVVTSGGGDAIHDVIKVARARLPGVSVVLSPTRVQGKVATPDIVRALRRIDEEGVCEVIILTRGGGSAEDLAAFNEEAVARAVAACRTPVISAVGHQSDFTLADLVSDRRASTPSNAAELATPERVALEARLHKAEVRLLRFLERSHAGAAMRLEQSEKRLERATRSRAQRGRARLEALKSRLQSASPRAQAEQRRRRAAELAARLEAAGPKARLRRAAQRVQSLEARLDAGAVAAGEGARRRLAVGAARLDALSPLRVLDRGFVVVQREGAAVARAASLSSGDRVELRFADGEVKAKVD